jgi:hypothetical protein
LGTGYLFLLVKIRRLKMSHFTYEGIGIKGEKLVHGKIYYAKAKGAPDEKGILREKKDEFYRPYKAAQSGSLFAMYPQDRSTGKVLPQYMEFSTVKSSKEL